jgi:hypothetical protein
MNAIKTIKAKYAGKCPNCRGPIKLGEEIGKIAGLWVCPTCVAAAPEGETGDIVAAARLKIGDKAPGRNSTIVEIDEASGDYAAKYNGSGFETTIDDGGKGAAQACVAFGGEIFRASYYIPGPTATTWREPSATFTTFAEAEAFAAARKGYERKVEKLTCTGIYRGRLNRSLTDEASGWGCSENGWKFEIVAEWKRRKIEGKTKIVRTK